MVESKQGRGFGGRILSLALGALAAGAVTVAWSTHSYAAPRDYVVTMSNMSYQIPGGLKVGDTIVWTNRDTVPHSATARDRSFDVRVGQGQSVRMVLRKAGTVAIYCIYHPAMRGSLTVAP